MPPYGNGPVNYEYAGSMPTGFNNEIRYQDMVEYQQVEQYQNMMTAGRAQMAAQRSSEFMNPRGYGQSGGDDLAKRMYQRQAYMSQQANTGGVLKGMTDMVGFTGVETALQVAGMRGAPQLIAPTIIASTLTKPVIRGIDNRMKMQHDIQSNAMDFDVYSKRLGFSENMSFQDATRAGAQMREQINGMSRGGFFDSGELSRIHKIGMSNGMQTARGGGAGNNGTMKQYKQNFKELTETTEEIVKTLKTTIEGGMSVMKEMNQLGFNNKQIKSQVKQMAAVAAGTGQSVQNVMGVAAAGAMAVQGTQWSARTGADMFTHNMAAAKNMGMGTGNGAAIQRVGGVAQAGAIIAGAQMNFMESGYGTKIMAYMMNDDRTLNKDRLGKVLNGSAGAYDVVTGANRRGYAMGASGRALFGMDKAEIFDNMDSSQREGIFNAGFDMWRKGRGGSKRAQAYVFAKQFASNANERKLLHKYLMRADGLDSTEAEYAVQAKSAIGEKTTKMAKGAMSSYWGEALGRDKLGISSGLEDLGAGMYDTFTSKGFKKGMGTFGATLKGAFSGALGGAAAGGMLGITGGPLAMGAGAALGAVVGGIGGALQGFGSSSIANNKNGGGVGSMMRWLGISSKYEMFGNGSSMIDTATAARADMGLTFSQTAAAGMGLIEAKQLANQDVTAGLTRSNFRWQDGNKFLGKIGFGTMTGAQRGIITDRVLRAKADGDIKGLFGDQEFVKLTGFGVDSPELAAMQAEAEAMGSSKFFGGMTSVLNLTRKSSMTKLNAINAKIEAGKSGMSVKDARTASESGKAAALDFARFRESDDIAKELGISRDADFATYNNAAKIYNQKTLELGYNRSKDRTVFASTSGLGLDIGRAELEAGRLNGTYGLNNDAYDMSATDAKIEKKLAPLLNDLKRVMKDDGTVGLTEKGKSIKKALKDINIDLNTSKGREEFIKQLEDRSSEAAQIAFKANGFKTEEEYNSWYSSMGDIRDELMTGEAVNAIDKRNKTAADQMRRKYYKYHKKTDKTEAFFDEFGGSFLMSADQAGAFADKNKDMLMNKLGIGDTEWKDWRKDVTGTKIMRTYTNTSEGKKDLAVDMRYEKEQALEAAKESVAKYNVDKKGDYFIDGKKHTKEEYESGLESAKKAKIRAEMDLENKGQEKVSGGSQRQTVIKPPVLSYWNNNWAVR